jgi:hypothetical protein
MSLFFRNQGREDRQLKLMARADRLKADIENGKMTARVQSSISDVHAPSAASRFLGYRVRPRRALMNQEWSDHPGLT